MTGIYAVTHMAVDLSCAFLMFSYVQKGAGWYLWILVYNFCAFAMQLPMGVLADRLNQNSRGAVLGCLGVLAGLALGASGFEAGAAILAGLGNAAFHVGGGIDVLNRSQRKMAPLGVFVAPGAAGIFLGTLLGREDWFAGWSAALLLLSAAGIYGGARRHKLWKTSGNALFSLEGAGRDHILAAACCLMAVILRSFAGMVQTPAGETSAEYQYLGWIMMAAVVTGKMAGGIWADRFGIKKSIAGASCCALAGFVLFEPRILGTFFWNMTMPITLWITARTFPRAKGFGFGLLTFGLFLGFCPVYLKNGTMAAGDTLLDRICTGAGTSAGMALMACMMWILLYMAYHYLRHAEGKHTCERKKGE